MLTSTILYTRILSYFRESWVCAVIHDRFPDLMQEVREDLTLVPAEVIPRPLLLIPPASIIYTPHTVQQWELY